MIDLGTYKFSIIKQEKKIQLIGKENEEKHWTINRKTIIVVANSPIGESRKRIYK